MSLGEELFMERFAPVLEEWGPDKFSDAYLNRVRERTADFNSLEMNWLCNMILETCDRRPSCSKVMEFVGYIKNRRRIVQQQEKPANHTTCRYCRDLGFVRVRELHGPADTLARCQCPIGLAHKKNLPVYSAEIASKFRAEPVPDDWFKPEQVAVGGTPMDQFWERVENWKIKINLAEQFWGAN